MSKTLKLAKAYQFEHPNIPWYSCKFGTDVLVKKTFAFIQSNVKINIKM